MLDKNKVEQFIKAALKYNGDKYSQPKRLVKGYSDCSSLIEKSLNDLGWNTRPGVAVTTHRMGVEGDSRFREIKRVELERGDILWYRNDKNGKYFGHVGIYLGNNQVLEAIYAGVGTHPISRINWQRVFRVKALETVGNSFTVQPFNSKGVVSANLLNVRDVPNINGNRLGQLKRGTDIEIVGKSGNWFKIKFESQFGYVSSAYVDLKNNKPVENVPILINGILIKKGYIIDGVTYISINGKDKPVRKLFEDIGADVRWQDNKVIISL